MPPEQTAPLKRIRRSVHDWLTLSLQGVMLVTIVLALLEGQWFNGFLVASILLITLTPRLIGKRYAVHIPAEFETLTIVFVFAALFLGEIGGYYEKFWWWDTLLHTASGFLLGVLGVLLVYVLNREPRIELHMKPGFVCLFAFTFAVAIGALWEIFEYAMDSLFGMNMQKSGVSRSGYYAWRERPASERSQRRKELVAEMQAIHSDRNLRCYGSPRMHRELVARGYRVSENTVARLMSAHGLQSVAARKFRATTDSNHPAFPRYLASDGCAQQHLSLQKQCHKEFLGAEHGGCDG